jgi:two-component sensor histidine kinase
MGVIKFRPATLKQGLILIVLVALLPIMLVSILQGMSTLKNTQRMASSQLSMSAQALAERERDPFIVAQHLLMTVSANQDVKEIGPGCNTALAASRRNYAPIINFVRTQADGVVRCSILPFQSGLSVAEEFWWQRTMSDGRLTISRPIIGSISRRSVLIMAMPIKSENSSDNGTLSAAIDVSRLAQSISGAPEANKGAASIITADGQVIANGKTAIPFKLIGPSSADGSNMRRDAEGKVWMYATASLYGSDLYVVYAEPRDSLLASAVAQVRLSVLLPLLSILFASLAIWFGTHRLVVRWLRDLGNVADKFSKGDFAGDRHKFDSAPVEIAELSADLHSMAQVIEKRSAELQHALDAKTALTREVHHRVKNNLQIITSLLTLQASRVSEPQSREVLAQTRARISALGLIHRTLYEQENDSERGEVIIDKLLYELCSQLRAANRHKKSVQLSCSSSAHPVPIDYAVPLSLFIVEAVTNAYRHAFNQEGDGQIKVELSDNDDTVLLEVSDNGVGFDANNNPPDMGMELMHAFATQVGGTLEIVSDRVNGTRLLLKLAKNI